MIILCTIYDDSILYHTLFRHTIQFYLHVLMFFIAVLKNPITEKILPWDPSKFYISAESSDTAASSSTSASDSSSASDTSSATDSSSASELLSIGSSGS